MRGLRGFVLRLDHHEREDGQQRSAGERQSKNNAEINVRSEFHASVVANGWAHWVRAEMRGW